MSGPAASRAREFGEPDRPRLTIVRGEGAYLYAADGRRYVDLGASHGVGNLGHAPAEVVAAVQRQVAELVHLGSGYASPARTAFLEKLVGLLPPPLSSVFLSNSGTESVEAAIKIARSVTGRPKVVATMRGFHGRTLGSLSATWRPEFREPFGPLLPEVAHIPFNDTEALARVVDDRTALVLIEPVQGEGGVHVAAPEFLRAARELTEQRGALLAFDEVQCGLGRTGRLFAFEHFGVTPDLLLLAKSLAGGVPIGATVTTPAVEARFRGSHHSTFGGNPLACAAGSAALEILVRDRLADRAARLGARALDRLARLPSTRVREVRGLGLMIGIELRERAAPALQRLEQEGYLAISAGPTVVRLLPPLVIGDEEWDRALDTVERSLAAG